MRANEGRGSECIVRMRLYLIARVRGREGSDVYTQEHNQSQAAKIEAERNRKDFEYDTRVDVEKERLKRVAEAVHWRSVDVLKQHRAEAASDAKQEIRNWDQKFAMNSAVYDHEVSVAYQRMLTEHSDAGHAVPKYFRDGAEDARQHRVAQRKKAQLTRPLW